MKLYDYLLKKYGTTQPIFIKDIKIDNTSKENIRMGMSRLLKNGKIKRKGTGIYYIPEKVEMLNEEKALPINLVCEKKYIKNDNNVIGFYTGLRLLNRVGFTTQVPNTIEIVTNKEKRNIRYIEIDGFKIILRKPYTKVTKENDKYLQFLELLRILEEEDFKDDKDNNYKNIRWYIEKNRIDLKDVKRYIYFYPKKVSKRFMEIEDKIIGTKK